MSNSNNYKTKSLDKWVKYFLGGCTITGCAIATYFIKHPEVVHPNQKPIYEKNISISNATPIHDLNGDNIPELRVLYNNKSIDTLFSHNNGNSIEFK